MRTLKFIVDKQVIKLDPKCNINDLLPGSEDYLEAEFVFSSEWNNCVKVAAFCSALGKEYPPQPIDSNNKCRIPFEATTKRVFKVRVLGRNTQYKLVTNKVEVAQRGGSK